MNAVYAILIVQLGSPSFSTRERASEVLAAQYPALPQLVLALKSPDPEVVARAQRLVDRVNDWLREQSDKITVTHRHVGADSQGFPIVWIFYVTK